MSIKPTTFLLFVLAIAIGLHPLAAAGKKEAAGTATRPKITYLTSVNVDTEGYDVNDNPYVAYLEQVHNVDLEIISEASQYMTKVNTIMASGNLPDYLQISGKNFLGLWATDGLLLPLDSLLENAPNLQRDMEPLAWDLSRVDGSIYAVPMQRYDKSPYLGFLPRAWVENLGVDTAQIRTIDDWYALLTSFVRDDPNRSGQADTHGMIARGTSAQTLETLFLDAFGAAQAREVNGEVLSRFILPEYRDWLKFMNRLYREGILDPEYVVNTSQQMWDKVRTGRYGAFSWFWSIQEYRSLVGTRDNLIAMPPPLRRDGSQAGFLYGSPLRHYISITQSSPHAEKIIEMLDWAFTDEGGTFVHAGLEGLDYDIVNGDIQVREDRRGKNWAWRFITVGIQKTKMDDHLQGLLQQSWGSDGLEHLNMSNEYGTYDYIAMLAPYFPELADYDLPAIELEFRDRAIIGQIDIDREWDNYVREWRRSGGNEWIRLHTRWYQTEYNRGQ